MRLRIFVNRSDPAFMHDYAVLWLDIKERTWSREAHRGIELPRTGRLRDGGREMTLYDPEGGSALCKLQGLRLQRNRRVDTSEGTVEWLRSRPSESIEGRWYLRAVVPQLDEVAADIGT
ncbi:DUF3564 domain-containing protein [Paraburkholderia terrae]